MRFTAPAIGCLLLLAIAGAGCEASHVEAREGQLVAVMASADEPLIRARPALSAGKYTRMALGLFDFYRGTLAMFRSDMRSGTTAAAVSSFSLDLPLVPSLGDPHPENFGALRAADGSIAIEPNDFDAADQAPYLWDVRRLAAGMAVAVAASNAGDSAALARAMDARRTIVRDAIAGYRAGIEDAARGTRPGRVVDGGGAIVADLFRRSNRDDARRRELADLTVIERSGQRKLKRGVVDPSDPQSVLADLPPVAWARLPAALDRYRTTLLGALPSSFFTLLDAVREFGSGVASWTRVKVLLLVRGPTDDPSDDVLLELKELADSGIAGLFPPGVSYDSVPDRIVATTREAWARPDAEPLWGATEWLGLPCQIRRETEGQKGVRVARMVEAEGTPQAIGALGAVLGRLVARVHASGPHGVENARAIYERIAIDPERFLDEQADAGVAYAELVSADHARFIRSLHRTGLRLGIPFDPADAPRPDLAALLGSPPPPPPLPSVP